MTHTNSIVVNYIVDMPSRHASDWPVAAVVIAGIAAGCFWLWCWSNNRRLK